MTKKDRKRLQELGYKWFEKKIDPLEKRALQEWLDEVADEPLEMLSPARNDEEYAAILFNKIQKQAGIGRRIRLWPRIAAAASIILALSISGYFMLNKKPTTIVAKNQVREIMPGIPKATLTLANGQTIILTKDLNGKVARQGNTLVQVKSQSITYTPLAVAKPSVFQVQFNKLSTVRGEQSPFPLILADGTKVWLNAESSIIFPTGFNGKERIVKITGEAYFEVAHDKTKPFRVITNDQEIQVLGTHFNVNAYADEHTTKTTLLEGSVKISAYDGHQAIVQTAMLKPGQQSELNNKNIQVKAINVDDAVAWKEGYFRFNREDIHSVMRKLSRWYDMDVVYVAKEDPLLIFGGRISQTKSLQTVLQIMEETGSVHFKIEGRRVIVME